MESAELSARLRYLNESAHLLATTAPATSKYLMSSCHSLLFENGLGPSEAQKRQACGACGTIMILGWEATLEQQKVQRKNGRHDVQISSVKVYKCNCCGRSTRQTISNSSQPHRPRNTYLNPSSLSAPTLSKNLQTIPLSAATTTVSASRRRPKNRKQGGLQAILNKQKAAQGTSSSGFGLDLLDFIKK